MLQIIISIFLLFVPLLSTFAQPDQKSKEKEKGYMFYLGTYTNGESRGIYQYLLTKDGMIQPLGLKAVTSNPSYLTFNSNKKYLLAVNENNPGTVSVFKIEKDTLILTDKKSSGGNSPCYISTDNAGWILTANYGSGTVGLLKMKNKGHLTPLLYKQKHFSSESKPHAHAAQFYPGSHQVIATDLGTNQLWFSHLVEKNNTLILDSIPTLDMPKGSGPRHFVFYKNPKLLFVVNELGNSVTIVEKEPDDVWKRVKTYSTLPEDFQGTSYAADIHFSPDHRFLYVSNRGFNTLAVFKVPENGKSIKLLAQEPVLGNWPRNFSITPDGKFLVVANQKSNNLVVFKRDEKSGNLTYVSQSEAASPVCILFCR